MPWHLAFPALFTLFAFVAIPAAAAAGAHALFRRFVPATRLLPHQEVAGFLVAVVGVLYAVALGFIVVTTWSAYDEAQRTADVEAGAVGDAFGFASMLPEPRRGDVQRMLAEYAIEVRGREWQTMRQGREDPRARALLIQLARALGEPIAKPSRDLDEALNRATTRTAVAASLRDVADNRRLRLIEAENGIQPVMAFALLLGAFMVIAFVFLFGVEDLALQLTMTALVAGTMGLLLGVIVVFSSPYAGPLRIAPSGWTYVIEKNGFEAIASGARQPRAGAATLPIDQNGPSVP
jgi:hypothetical protein